MTQVLVLPSSKSDEAMFRFFDYLMFDDNGIREVDYTVMQDLGLKDLILNRMKSGFNFLRTYDLEYGGYQITEIQWR